VDVVPLQREQLLWAQPGVGEHGDHQRVGGPEACTQLLDRGRGNGRHLSTTGLPGLGDAADGVVGHPVGRDGVGEDRL
jgi:hypothetical protein